MLCVFPHSLKSTHTEGRNYSFFKKGPSFCLWPAIQYGCESGQVTLEKLDYLPQAKVTVSKGQKAENSKKEGGNLGE